MKKSFINRITAMSERVNTLEKRNRHLETEFN